MKKIVGAASVVTAMFLNGCAGRAPQPVAVVQPQDRYADCAAIIAEGQANNRKIQDLAGDEGSKVTQNVAAGVVGLFIWPVWFGMDFQGTAGKEVAALQSRQQYLAVMAEQRNCAAPISTPASTPIAPTAIPPVATQTPAPSPPAPPPAALTSAAVTSAPTPAGAWPSSIPPLAPSAAPAFAAPAASTPSATPSPAPAPPQPVAAVSPPASAATAAPAMPSAASDINSYEEAQQQYRQAEQQYQRQLELQRTQGR